jgi:hypothetical protein
MAFSNKRLRTGTVTVGTTVGGTQIVPSDPNRLSIKIWNTDSADVGYVGVGTVSATSGIPMAAATAPADPLELEGTDEIKGFVAAATLVFAYAEVYQANG